MKDIRAIPAFNTCTEDKVREVVRRDSKRRFGTKVTEECELWVRANHGHGIPGVDVVEREFTVRDLLGYVVHASSLHAWSLIRYEGLKRGRRGYIHFVRRAPKAEEVVAGVRRGGEVCIFVDAQKAIEDGIPFFITPREFSFHRGTRKE